MNDVERTLKKLRRREHQAAVLADLGHAALTLDNLQLLFDQAAIQVSESLGVRFCEVLKLLPDKQELLLVAGAGWKSGVVGRTTVGAALDSQAGFTLETEGPVIVGDLRNESRFEHPELLTEHGVTSGISVVIGPRTRPWGVLGAHSNDAVGFTGEDAYFVQAVANTLWDAINRNQIEESLREADQRKDRFIAVLAHELRNPLASISTALDILELAGDKATISQSRDIAKRQVKHLTRLVDDLLDVSRITQGRLKLRKQRVDLRQIIESSISDSRHILARFQHTLSLSLPESGLFVDADPVRLTQVLANLVSNAAKYTPTGGRIDVRAMSVRAGVTIVVKDNGIGIPEENLDSIFEMFAQSGGFPENDQSGMGIGLNLTRSLIELHGGHISVISEGVGRGAEFTVWLPGSQRTPESEPARSKIETKSIISKRVLVVEDNQDAATSLAKLLGLLGHEVRIAYDGHQALQVADRFRPQLILLDVGLPRLNGYEVAKRLRAMPWGSDVTLVAVTGWGQEEDRRKAEQSGIDQHVTKPLSLTVLKDILATT